MRGKRSWRTTRGRHRDVEIENLIRPCRGGGTRTRRSSRRPSSSRCRRGPPPGGPPAALARRRTVWAIRRWPAEPCSCVPNRGSASPRSALRAAATTAVVRARSSSSGPGESSWTPSGVAAGWHARRSPPAHGGQPRGPRPWTAAGRDRPAAAGTPPLDAAVRRWRPAPAGGPASSVDADGSPPGCATCDRRSPSTRSPGRSTRSRGRREIGPAGRNTTLHSVPGPAGGGASRQAPLDPGDLAPRRPRRAEARVRIWTGSRCSTTGTRCRTSCSTSHPRLAGRPGRDRERIEDDLRAARSRGAAARVPPCVGPASRLATSPARRPARIATGQSSGPRGLTSASATRGSRRGQGCARCAASFQRLGERRVGDRSRHAWATTSEPGRRVGDGRREAGDAATFGALQWKRAPLGILAATAGAAVLGSPPLRPASERLAWAYLATVMGVGLDAAGQLPLEPCSGRGCDRRGAGRRRPAPDRCGAWARARPQRARGPDARGGRHGGARGDRARAGVTAGYRLVSARLPEPGRSEGGSSSRPPGSARSRWPADGATSRHAARGGCRRPRRRPPDRMFAAPSACPMPRSSRRTRRGPWSKPHGGAPAGGEPVAFDGCWARSGGPERARAPPPPRSSRPRTRTHGRSAGPGRRAQGPGQDPGQAPRAGVVATARPSAKVPVEPPATTWTPPRPGPGGPLRHRGASAGPARRGTWWLVPGPTGTPRRLPLDDGSSGPCTASCPRRAPCRRRSLDRMPACSGPISPTAAVRACLDANGASPARRITVHDRRRRQARAASTRADRAPGDWPPARVCAGSASPAVASRPGRAARDRLDDRELAGRRTSVAVRGVDSGTWT